MESGLELAHFFIGVGITGAVIGALRLVKNTGVALLAPCARRTRCCADGCLECEGSGAWVTGALIPVVVSTIGGDEGERGMWVLVRKGR